MSEAIRARFLKKMAETRQFREEILFHPFTPSKDVAAVEISVGSKFPVAAAQAAIEEVCGVPDLKVTLTVMSDDEGFGNTQRMYIGGLVQRSKTPVTSERLKAILNPSLTRRQFLALLGDEK